MAKLPYTFARKYDVFIRDFLNSGHPVYSLYGGRNSGKSTSLYMLEVAVVMTEGCVMVIRKNANTLEESSYNGIVKVIQKYNLGKYFKFRKNPLRIICEKTGYVISFKGLDDPEKVKSSEAPKGNYRLAVFEEAQEIKKRSICEEAISTWERGEGSEGFRTIYVWNPPANKNHWLNKEFRDSDPGFLFALHVNYLDIPKKWVGQDLVKIEKLKVTHPKVYRHRYLGEPLADEDVVFENVETVDISDEQIAEWFKQDKYLFCGLDFGYKPDPNAGVFMKYDPDNRFLYIFKEMYRGELNNQQISDELETCGFSRDYLIVSDNDQKTINDLRSMGWRIQSAVKGPGSIEISFKWLQGLSKIFIDNKRCPNTAEEFLLYHYCMDKFGNIKDGYKDTDNQADHSIAAVRYGMEPLWRRAGA